MELCDPKKVGRIVSVLNRPSCTTHVHLFGLNSSSVSSTFRAVISTLQDGGNTVIPVNLLLVNGSLPYFYSEIVARFPNANEQMKIKTLSDLFDILLSGEGHRSYDHPIIIAISHAEEIRKFSSLFGIAFFKCLKQKNGKIKALTMAQIPWAKIETTCSLSVCIQFGFESFTKEELILLLQKHFLHERNKIKLSLDLSYATCRDVKLLGHMIKGLEEEKYQKKLKMKMKHIVDYSTSGFSHGDFKAASQATIVLLDLPKSEIVLLIAAYCATYNPPGSDCRIFGTAKAKVLSEGSQRKKNGNYEKVPKPFDLQRVQFIYLALLKYFSLLEYGTSSIFALINDLCLLGFLIRTSADGNLDVMKYKCVASDELLIKAAE